MKHPTTTNRPLDNWFRQQCQYKWLNVRPRARNQMVFEMRMKGFSIEYVMNMFSMSKGTYTAAFNKGREDYEREKKTARSDFFTRNRNSIGVNR